MKFCVKNDLSIFEFHDSEFSFVSYDGTDLVVSASMVNIHKDTPQNTSDHDLEITSGRSLLKTFIHQLMSRVEYGKWEKMANRIRLVRK